MRVVDCGNPTPLAIAEGQYPRVRRSVEVCHVHRMNSSCWSPRFAAHGFFEGIAPGVIILARCHDVGTPPPASNRPSVQRDSRRSAQTLSRPVFPFLSSVSSSSNLGAYAAFANVLLVTTCPSGGYNAEGLPRRNSDFVLNTGNQR